MRMTELLVVHSGLGRSVPGLRIVQLNVTKSDRRGRNGKETGACIVPVIVHSKSVS